LAPPPYSPKEEPDEPERMVTPGDVKDDDGLGTMERVVPKEVIQSSVEVMVSKMR
jgi:hypothetical protein